MIQKHLFQGLLFGLQLPLADSHQRQQVLAEPVLQHRERHALLQRQHQQHDLAGRRRGNHPRLQVHLRRTEPHAGCYLWRRHFPKQQRQPLHRKGDWLRQEREHTCLQRYGQTGTSSYGLIDNLTFTLDGNQLNRVDDAVTSSAYNNGFEFKDAVKQANEYAYDANGNLTKDLNKNISEIQYNCLNLPRKVMFTDGSTIEYTYAADGTKLRTKHVINGTTTTTDYCGNVIYENGVQKLLLTEAGYLTLADSKYHYYLQDHQGNNRVVIDQNGTVEETNHYYPFGGVFANSTSVQPYKYNGKELDTKKGLNWYDYGARHYDAAVGRFHTQDRFAEKYYPMSPYQYAANCPMRNIDVNDDSIIIAPNSNGLLDKIRMYFSSWGFKTKYQTKVESMLNQLKEDDPTVKKLIEGLEDSEHVITITQISKDLRAKGVKNATIHEASDPTVPQGATVMFDPYLEETQFGMRHPRVGLAHELGHADDYAQGLGIKFNRKAAKEGDLLERMNHMLAEKHALYIENLIRKK